MDAILKVPNLKGNGYIQIAIDVTIISGITKSQENGTSGILHGNSIFNICENIKKDNYNNDCSANNIQYYTFAITKDGGLSNESYKLLDMIENYGSTTLKRTKIQHNYFRKKLSVKVLIDQAKIVSEKINALIERTNNNMLSQMEEISNYLTVDQNFNFDFPLENPTVINYNKTAVDDFQSENSNSNDDNSTVIDNSSIENDLNNINNILTNDNNNNNKLHIDNFGDDLESLSDDDFNVNNNNNNVDDDDG